MNLLAAGLVSVLAPSAFTYGYATDALEDAKLYWPERLAPASRLYQCSPPGHTLGRASVLVWTDRKGQVMAVGAALEGGSLPSHALALVNQAHGQDSDSLRIAAPGYAVRTVGRGPLLRVGPQALACQQTSDD